MTPKAIKGLMRSILAHYGIRLPVRAVKGVWKEDGSCTTTMAAVWEVARKRYHSIEYNAEKTWTPDEVRASTLHEIGHVLHPLAGEYAAHRWALFEAHRRRWRGTCRLLGVTPYMWLTSAKSRPFMRAVRRFIDDGLLSLKTVRLLDKYFSTREGTRRWKELKNP